MYLLIQVKLDVLYQFSTIFFITISATICPTTNAYKYSAQLFSVPLNIFEKHYKLAFGIFFFNYVFVYVCVCIMYNIIISLQLNIIMLL